MKYGERVPQSGKPKIAQKTPVRPRNDGVGRVAGLGSILGVWAHPDDESFLTAGLMAAAAKNGQKVVCITATKGEEGVQNEAKWPKAKLGGIREKELNDAFDILGIPNHFWLGYHDGACKKVPQQEGTQKVLDFIKKHRPKTIITFPPDGITGHDDHRAVSSWSREAIKQSGQTIKLLYGVDTLEMYNEHFKEIDEKFNIYFNIDKPVLVPEAKCDIIFRLSPELAHKKMLALKAQPSQTEGIFKEFGEELFEESVKTEAYVFADPANPAKWPL